MSSKKAFTHPPSLMNWALMPLASLPLAVTSAIHVRMPLWPLAWIAMPFWSLSLTTMSPAGRSPTSSVGKSFVSGLPLAISAAFAPIARYTSPLVVFPSM